MQLLHQRDNKGSKRGKIKIYPKSDASDLENWVISPLNAFKRRARKIILTQRMLHQKLTKRTMIRIAP